MRVNGLDRSSGWRDGRFCELRGNRVNAEEEEILRVVLVEDDEEFAKMYKFRLEKDGYRVTVAADGRQASS